MRTAGEVVLAVDSRAEQDAQSSAPIEMVRDVHDDMPPVAQDAMCVGETSCRIDEMLQYVQAQQPIDASFGKRNPPLEVRDDSLDAPPAGFLDCRVQTFHTEDDIALGEKAQVGADPAAELDDALSADAVIHSYRIQRVDDVSAQFSLRDQPGRLVPHSPRQAGRLACCRRRSGGALRS